MHSFAHKRSHIKTIFCKFKLYSEFQKSFLSSDFTFLQFSQNEASIQIRLIPVKHRIFKSLKVIKVIFFIFSTLQYSSVTYFPFSSHFILCLPGIKLHLAITKVIFTGVMISIIHSIHFLKCHLLIFNLIF